MNSFYDKAGPRIRYLREVNGYTREDLSELAGISSKFLYEIETGQKGFSADTLYRIAQALSVSCDYILSGKTKNGTDDNFIDILNLFDETEKIKINKILKIIYNLEN